MSILIRYTSECTCGDRMVNTTLDLTQEPGDRIEIDLDMLGDMVMECTDCGRRAFVPDLGDYIEEIEP